MKQAARSQSRQRGGLRSVHTPDPETGPPYPAEALAARGLATAGGTLAVAFASPYDLRSTVKDLGSKDRSACCISPNAAFTGGAVREPAGTLLMISAMT